MQTKIKKNGFIQGIVILIISQGLTKILGLVYTLYLVNREGFGDSGNAIYASGYQIYAMLLTLSSIGVPNAISKMVSERLAVGDFKSANRIFKISLATFSFIGLTGTAVLFLGAHYIANVLLQIPEAQITLKVLSPAIFFVSVASVLKGYFNGMENMEGTAKSQIIEQAGKTCLTIIIVEFIAHLSKTSTKYMAAGATIATTVATFLGFIYLVYYYYLCRKKIGSDIHKSVNYKYERVSTIIKNILKVSIPIALSSIMASLTKNIDSITVVRELKKFLSISEAKIQYGILSGKIETLVAFPLSFNLAFATALVPAISAANATRNFKQIREKISFSLLIGIIIGIPCTIGMIIYAKQILDLLFPNANKGIEILQISSISIVFVILAQTISGALQGLGKELIPAKAFGIGIIIKIICNIILIKIPSVGIKGAAIGTVLCNLVAFVISYKYLKNITNIKLNFIKYVLKPIIASIIMCICSYWILILLQGIIPGKLVTIITLISAVIIYFITIIILKLFSEEDILKLPLGSKIYKILYKIGVYSI